MEKQNLFQFACYDGDGDGDGDDGGRVVENRQPALNSGANKRRRQKIKYTPKMKSLLP